MSAPDSGEARRRNRVLRSATVLFVLAALVFLGFIAMTFVRSQ